jgi:transcription initiation factor TFIIIB Brf1 subunit/transcription initiation factor TFIIB
MSDLASGDELEADELRILVHENAGGPVQGAEYRDVARWEIETVTIEIDAPELIQQALELYDEIIQNSVIRYRELTTVASAAVHITARQAEVPVTQRTIADAGHTTAQKLGRLVTDLQRELDLVVLPPPPTAYLEQIQTRLELPVEARVQAEELVSETLSARSDIQSGRTPGLVAAASMYHICRRDGYGRTQQAVADAADVDVAALRDIYQQQATIDSLPLDES